MAGASLAMNPRVLGDVSTRLALSFVVVVLGGCHKRSGRARVKSAGLHPLHGEAGVGAGHGTLAGASAGAEAAAHRRDAVASVTELVAALADRRQAMWLREEAQLAGGDWREARAASHATRAAITAPPYASPSCSPPWPAPPRPPPTPPTPCATPPTALHSTPPARTSNAAEGSSPRPADFSAPCRPTQRRAERRCWPEAAMLLNLCPSGSGMRAADVPHIPAPGLR